MMSVITMESHNTLSTSGDYGECHNNKQLRERSSGVRTQETEYRHLPLSGEQWGASQEGGNI